MADKDYDYALYAIIFTGYGRANMSYSGSGTVLNNNSDPEGYSRQMLIKNIKKGDSINVSNVTYGSLLACTS